LDDFLNHLKVIFEHNGFLDLDNEEDEYGEVTRALYAELIGCVRNQADTICITNAHMNQYKRGIMVRQRDISWHEQSGLSLAPADRGLWMSYRTGMKVILKHDEQVRYHLQLVEETPEKVTYQIIL
jgi:hypothetical protein